MPKSTFFCGTKIAFYVLPRGLHVKRVFAKLVLQER